MLCLGMHSNVMHRFMVQAFHDTQHLNFIPLIIPGKCLSLGDTFALPYTVLKIHHDILDDF
jgi:hypothetical protein